MQKETPPFTRMKHEPTLAERLGQVVLKQDVTGKAHALLTTAEGAWVSADGHRLVGGPERIEPLSFDLDSEEGLEETARFVEGSYAQAVHIHDHYEGKWPVTREYSKRNYTGLYKDIGQQRTLIRQELEDQREFLLKRTLADKGAAITNHIVEIQYMIDALYEMANDTSEPVAERMVAKGDPSVRLSEQAVEAKEEEPKSYPGGAEVAEVEPSAEDKVLFKYLLNSRLPVEGIPESEREQYEQEVWKEVAEMPTRTREKLIKKHRKEELANIQEFVESAWREVQQKILDQLKGSWPSAECTRLYEEAAEKYDNLQEIVHAQKAFLTGNGPDQSVTLKAAMREFDGNVRLLFTTVIAAQESLSPGNESDNEAIPEVQNGEGVLTAKEFEDFKQRIHRRQEAIDAILRVLEPVIPQEYRHYLDELIAERKAITDIVVEGLEEAKIQDAATKVYSAELVTRAAPHFSRINQVIDELNKIYPSQAALSGGDSAQSMQESNTEAVLTEPRALSPAEEMKLLEAFFLPNMEGQDDVEKLALLRKQLREMPPEEWTDALLDAREAFTDEELEALLGPVVTPTPVSGGVVPAPVSPAPFVPGAAVAAAAMPGVPPQPAAPKAPEPAPAAAPEKTLTPEQQATRDKWLAARKKLLFSVAADGAETTSENRYEDPAPDDIFAVLRESQKEKALEGGAWRYAKVDADGNVILTNEDDPLTFDNRRRALGSGEADTGLYRQFGEVVGQLTPDQAQEFAWEYFNDLSPGSQIDWYLYAKERAGELTLSEEKRQELLEDHILRTRDVNSERNYGDATLAVLYEAATTEEEKATLLAARDKALAALSDIQKADILSQELSLLSPEDRANLLSAQPENDTEVPLQNTYQNKLTAYYDSLKTEGSGFQRFGKRIAATFGFKPELPPELDATREAMFDATADYTKETRAMLALRAQTGKEVKRAFTKERKAELLRLHVMRFLTTTAGFPNMYEEYKASDAETKKTLLLEAQAQVDQLPSEERTNAMGRAMESVDTFLTPEQQAAYAVEAQEAVQRRYEKMLGRSVLMGTFERQLDAQRQVTEDLAFQAPEVLKKHKRKITLFAAGAIGGITGGISSAAMGVTRALAGGALGASIGGFVGEKWKNRIERKTKDDKEVVLNSLAERLSKDSITAGELQDTYRELKKIYETADSQTRTRIASLMAIALAVGLATGEVLEFGAEGVGLIDAPVDGSSSAAAGATSEGANSSEVSDPNTEQSLRSQAEGGGTASDEAATAEGSLAASEKIDGATESAAETSKTYEAQAGDNMWDILEGQTNAGELSVLKEADPATFQSLLKEVELKLDADEALRTEIGFGESSHDLGLGDTVNVERLNEVALEIAKEKGMLADAEVAEAAADTPKEATPTESVETPAADALPEQPTAPTIEAAAEAATVKAEAAADTTAANSTSEALVAERKPISFPYEADRVYDSSTESIPGKTIDMPHLGNDPSKVGGPIFDRQPYYEGLHGADQVKAYAANYEGGALRFVSQEVQPFVEQTEGVANNGFFGLFKTPPPPSMGGYALFQHVPLREMAEVNALPDDTLLPTLTEKYHVENPEQFSVWVEKLNDMQSRDVFNLDQTPELTLADAVALDVINSKTTSV